MDQMWRVCVCMCVCVRKRDRDRDRDRGRERGAPRMLQAFPLRTWKGCS